MAGATGIPDLMAAWWIALAVVAGSIPFGLLIARQRGIDVRTVGSGNIGATNVARTLGKKFGAVVLLLDAGKGAAPVLLARAADEPTTILAAVGFAAICGHCFTPWLRFRGGKGVATALGVYFVLVPAAAGLGIIAFAAALAVTRITAIGSLSASVCIALLLLVRGPDALAVFGVAVAVLLFFTHRSNLNALLRKRTKP